MKHIVLSIFLVVCSAAFAQKSIKELEREQEAIRRQIELTNSLIKRNEEQKSISLKQLHTIDRKIELHIRMISSLNHEVDNLTDSIKRVNYNIEITKQEINDIKEEYSKIVYHTWERNKAGNDLLYILAGKDYQMMYRRHRYLAEYGSLRKIQIEKASNIEARLKQQLSKYDSLVKEKQLNLDKVKVQNKELALSKQKNKSYLQQLGKKQSTLEKDLTAQLKKSEELKKFIDDIIAKELAAKKKKSGKSSYTLTPEQKQLSSSFEKNKGKLPWPVSRGVIIRKYGKYRPKNLKKVLAENYGIDIETDENGVARAVFNGTVTGVYRLPEMHGGVIVEHGNYLTFYAGLVDIKVKKGDKVSTKQPLGKIYNDKEKGTVLHFEVYYKTKRHNPSYWITK